MVEDSVFASATSDEDPELIPTPRLPLELERLIFELAFDPDDPRSNARMVLIAQRVYYWLMPMIYRVFVQVLGGPLYPDLAKVQATGSLPKICQLARHMIIYSIDEFYTPQAIADLLDKCHNLEDLACWHGIRLGDDPTWSTLSKLRHLKRLCGRLPHVTNHQLRQGGFARISRICW
ncbi:hypothetical protein BJ165DRAFT_5660 [Panaeolus papilionaceus]|nr:hypothetical protein BJ165DRAFT_5660 [Panaeolus papilionaceus]